VTGGADALDIEPYDEFAGHEPPAHHIGRYLAWLVRGGLVDESRFDAEQLHAVRTGARPGTDLELAVSGKLSPVDLTDEGRRFSDYYYDRYLTEYDRLAAGGVVPANDAVQALIDERYGQWVARGRPVGKRPMDTSPSRSRGAGRGVESTTGNFVGSTWTQIEQQKAELARTMHLAFRDDPSTPSTAYGDETPDEGEIEPDAAAAAEATEPRPRWKFWR